MTCAACCSGGLVTTLGVKCLTVRVLTAFDNEFDGLACYQTTQSNFTGLYLPSRLPSRQSGAGISVHLAFDHNVISNAVLKGNDLGIFMRASRDDDFHDITIHDSHHYGVFMAHAVKATAAGARPAPQSACTHNAFTNLAANNCGGAAFRVNNSSCKNNVIIHPSFDGNLRGGISQPRPNLVSVR